MKRDLKIVVDAMPADPTHPALPASDKVLKRPKGFSVDTGHCRLCDFFATPLRVLPRCFLGVRIGFLLDFATAS